MPRYSYFNTGVIMPRYLFLIFFLLYSFAFSDSKKKENSFFGHWTLDIEKSLAANILPKNSINDFQNTSIYHKITFTKSGKYKEKFGDLNTEGTWSRYKKDLAVARIETDEKIRARRDRLKRKLSNPKLTRYQKTRLEQKLYSLDRASVKSYNYKDGYVILNLKRQDKEIRLFFRKGI